jgi:hypothetical protein
MCSILTIRPDPLVVSRSIWRRDIACSAAANWYWHFGLQKRRGTSRERGFRLSRTEPGDAAPAGMNSLPNSFAPANFRTPLALDKPSELLEFASAVPAISSLGQIQERLEGENSYT